MRDGRRRVVEIIAPTGNVVEGIVEASTIFRLSDGGLEPTGELPARTEPFERAGIDLRALTAGSAETTSDLARPAIVSRDAESVRSVSWDAVR